MLSYGRRLKRGDLCLAIEGEKKAFGRRKH